MGFAAIRTEVRAGFATKAELEALAKSTRATLTGAAAAANETPTGWMIGIMVGAGIGGCRGDPRRDEAVPSAPQGPLPADRGTAGSVRGPCATMTPALGGPSDDDDGTRAYRLEDLDGTPAERKNAAINRRRPGWRRCGARARG